MNLYDIGKQVAREFHRIQYEQAAWTEDMITSGLLARQPVSHVTSEPSCDRYGLFSCSDGIVLSVVLAGGHVWARREWRYTS